MSRSYSSSASDSAYAVPELKSMAAAVSARPPSLGYGRVAIVEVAVDFDEKQLVTKALGCLMGAPVVVVLLVRL